MLRVINDEINSERFKGYTKEGQKMILALKEKYERPVAQKDETKSNIPTITTKEEYDKLPRGTQYKKLDENGVLKTYRKK